MIIIGITGSIGMGKSDTAAIFHRQGVPVFDSDAEVRRLSRPGGAAMAAITEAFPQSVIDGQLDRARLGEEVFGNDKKRLKLENILHPLVRRAQKRFLFRWARRGAEAVLIDVPLLFEGGLERLFDQVITVTASAETQRQRVLSRPGMTGDKLERILAAQMPDLEKKESADVIIDTSSGRGPVYSRVRSLLRSYQNRRGQALRRWRRGYA